MIPVSKKRQSTNEAKIIKRIWTQVESFKLQTKSSSSCRTVFTNVVYVFRIIYIICFNLHGYLKFLFYLVMYIYQNKNINSVLIPASFFYILPEFECHQAYCVLLILWKKKKKEIESFANTELFILYNKYVCVYLQLHVNVLMGKKCSKIVPYGLVFVCFSCISFSVFHIL